MKNFKELLLEIDYKGRDELESDSRLIFQAAKKHLSDHNNFKKLLKNRTDKTFVLPLSHVGDRLHPDLHKKYKGMHLRFSGQAGKIGNDGAFGKFHPSFISKVFNRVKPHISLYMLPSLNAPVKDHKSFIKDLKGSFPIFHHEFVHAHDNLIKKDNFVRPKNSTYYNMPHEKRAFSAQLNHELDHAMTAHPEHFKGIKDITHDPKDIIDRLHRSKMDKPQYNNLTRNSRNWHHIYDNTSDKTSFHSVIKSNIDKHINKNKLSSASSAMKSIISKNPPWKVRNSLRASNLT